MPNHQQNHPRDVVARLRRGRALHRDLRRRGATPTGVGTADEAGTEAAPRTTVEATIRPVGRDRYRRLALAPGEPHLVRGDLGVAADPGRAATRRSLLYVAHHTDVHICDAQSPARLEGGETWAWVNPGSDGGHRPQETCTTHVLDQLVRATNAVATSPLTGAPMAWCIQTGDNTDNRTVAEVRWWIDVLAGRPVTPNTGADGVYEGVQRSGWRTVWHPDRPGGDRPQRAGFPYLPGFLDAAVAPFAPAGLDVPWLAVFGNHDQIFSGTFGPARGIRMDLLEPMLFASAHKPSDQLGLIRALLHASLLGADPARWARWGRGPGIHTVTPDPDARRSMTLDEYLRALLADGADGDGPGPAGHGFGPEHLVAHASWWTRAEGEHVQVIGLDTCNHTTGDGGCLGPRQLAWLEAELARHHRRALDPSGAWVDTGGTDRLVVIASHHNSWTMDNPADDEVDPGPRTSGPELAALLDRHPNVIAWVNGHSHEHKIVPHRRRGAGQGAGWWEINTSSAIDFGQQGRTIELLDNRDGTVSVMVTVLDHQAPAAVPHRTDGRWTPGALASMSRELAANDNRWIDPIALLGRPEDRNVELLVAAPFALG